MRNLLNKVNVTTIVALLIITLIGVLFGSCATRQLTFVGEYKITKYTANDTTCTTEDVLLQYNEGRFNNISPFRLILQNDSIVLPNPLQFYRISTDAYNGLDSNNKKYLITFPGRRELRDGILLGVRDSLSYRIIAAKCYN